jgi:hypothetical protein
LSQCHLAVCKGTDRLHRRGGEEWDPMLECVWTISDLGTEMSLVRQMLMSDLQVTGRVTQDKGPIHVLWDDG